MNYPSILLVIFLTAMSTACGVFEGSDDDKKEEIIRDRNNTADARSCRSEGSFWDATSATCRKEVALATFECNLENVKGKAFAKDKVEETADQGFRPLECGEQAGDMPQIYVTWSKKNDDSVELQTFAYITADQKPTEEPK